MSGLTQFLKSTLLFQDFSEEELATLTKYISVKNYSAGEWIAKEKEVSKEFFLVMSGNLEVVKEEKEFEHQEKLETLHKGDWGGEMAYIESKHRSASIRAISPSEVVILSLDRLEKSEDRALYSKLIHHLAKKMSERLRTTNRSLIETLNHKLRTLQLNEETARALVALFILLSIWFNFSKIISLFPGNIILIDSIFTSLMLVLFSIIAIYEIRKSSQPLSFFGLTTKNWLKQSIEATIYTIPIMGLLLGVIWFATNHIDKYKGYAIFAPFPGKAGFAGFFITVILYAIFIPIQELIARGFCQSYFRRFFQGPNRVFLAILTSNLIFELLHTVKNTWLALATFFLGLFWGVLFEKQRSIIGVSVSHLLVGIWTFAVLNFQELLFL